MDIQNLEPAQAIALIDAGTVRVVDVRTPEEFERYRLSDAVLFPLQQFETALPLPDDGDDRPTLFYCEHGIRSMHACHAWNGGGGSGDVVYNLTGGMALWIAQELPHVTGRP